MIHRLLSGLVRGEDRPRIMAELYFGDFRFDTRGLRLEGGSGVLEIRAKTLELLTYLIEQRNRFVPREELMSRLWPDVTVTDASLTQCVSELRQVLGDSSKEPRYIETRIKKGYRFVAVVYHRPTERLEPLPPPPEVTHSLPNPIVQIGPVALATVVVAAATILAVWWFTGGGESRAVAIEVVQLASSVTDASTNELCLEVFRQTSDRLSTVDGLEVTRPTGNRTSPVTYQLEFACTAASTGHEFSVLLRSARHGDTRWGWTWIVPAGNEGRARLPDEIAARVFRAVVEELGLNAGHEPPSDPHHRAG